GKLDVSPIRIVHTPAASAVHAPSDRTTSGGIPAPARILGLTNRMYAIVRKVAMAPRSSRPTVLPRFSSSNRERIRAMRRYHARALSEAQLPRARPAALWSFDALVPRSI